jgi:hypothetical protein
MVLRRLLLAAVMTFVGAPGERTVNCADCNDNDVEDAIDLAGGTSADCNLNGIPDECEILPGRLLLDTGKFFPAELQPLSIAAGDLDGDEILDLATANHSNTVAVYRGMGGGDFAAPITYPAGGMHELPWRVALGDLDGDGDLDLVTSDSAAINTPGYLSLLFNNGNGRFAGRTLIAAGDKPVAVVIADINGDGRPDLISANRGSNDLSLLENEGNLVFRAPASLPAGQTPRDVLALDLNGNGALDLVALNESSDDLTVLFQAENVVFSPPLRLPVGRRPQRVAAADIDRNGHVDLLVANAGPVFREGSLSLWRNYGNGTFTREPDFAPGNNPSSLTLADLDGDGHLDLAIATSAVRNLSVAWNNGQGFFAPSLVLGVGVSGNQRAADVIALDANADGRLDVIASATTVSLQPGKIAVLLNRGNRSFAAELNIPLGQSLSAATAGDLDGDGDLDVAASLRVYVFGPPEFGQLAVVENQGGDSFATMERLPLLDYDPRSVEMADIDGDGRLDILTVNAGLSQRSPGSISRFLNRGGGTFERARNLIGAEGPRDLAVGDLDGDGAVDLVTANSPSGRLGPPLVTVFRNLGGGDFAGPLFLTAARYPESVALADLDLDGRIDIATVNFDYGRETVSVFLNQGESFAPAVTFPAAYYAMAIAAGDLDGDGYPELATANVAQSFVSVFTNRGDGSFAASLEVPAGNGAAAVTIADLDGNGAADILVTRREADVVSVILNRRGARFAPPLDVPAGDSPRSIGAFDLDGDGDLEILTANFDSGDLSIIRNATPKPAAPDCNGNGIPDECDIASLYSSDANGNGIPDECDPRQLAGDCNQDGDRGISDVICYVRTLLEGFLLLERGRLELPCPGGLTDPGNAAILDIDGNGRVDLLDAISLARHLFSAGPPPSQGADCFPVAACGENLACRTR